MTNEARIEPSKEAIEAAKATGWTTQLGYQDSLIEDSKRNVLDVERALKAAYAIDFDAHQQAMQVLQGEVARLKRPWKVVLAVSTTERVDLPVIDIGHSDHILTVECQGLQDQIDRLQAELATLRAEHLSNCLFHRCSTHLATPQINQTEYTGAECGACIAEDRDGIAKAAHELVSERDRLQEKVHGLAAALKRLLIFNKELCEDFGISSHYPSAEQANAALAAAAKGGE